MTDRDKAANDVLHLLSLTTPRTDAPTTLLPVVVPGPPLACEQDDASTQERLLIQRSELRIATNTGTYRDRPVKEYSIPRNQMSFLTIALLRVLDGAEYADRVQWLSDFNAIETGADAAIFMTEAKLKVECAFDMKKVTREGEQVMERTKRRTKW